MTPTNEFHICETYDAIIQTNLLLHKYPKKNSTNRKLGIRTFEKYRSQFQRRNLTDVSAFFTFH